MKIKTKKEMNLPELIEWGFKQEELPPLFYGSKEGSLVQFTPGGWVNITAIEPTDTFTVEIEEQITEDTVIPEMLVIGRFDGYDKVYNQKLSSFNQHLLSAYLIHDDGHMELIYDEEKGLVG